MSKYKYEPSIATIAEFKAMEEHFANMAKEGWMVDKIGTLFIRYRATEPRELQFFADLVPQYGIFEPPQGQKVQQYRRSREKSGWTFACATNQNHVFYAEAEAVPASFSSDVSEHAGVYLSAARRWLAFMAFAALPLPFLIPNALVLYTTMFYIIGLIFVFIGFTWAIGVQLLWMKRLKQSVRLNQPLPTINFRHMQIRGNLYVYGLIFFVCCLIAGIVMDSLMRDLTVPPWIWLVAFLPIVIGSGIGLGIRHLLVAKRLRNEE